MTKFRFRTLLAALTLAGVVTASAEDFPTRPIRLVVPYPPGGTTDIMARVLQEPMAKFLGQPVIVENKPGVAGMIGTLEVARGKADGYTLLFANNGISIAPFLQKTAEFDPRTSLAAVSRVSRAPFFLTVGSRVPVTDVAGFIEYVKGRPDKVLYASAGPGSFGHLASELFAQRAGLKMVHVPYRGQAPTTQAILAGEVEMLLSTTSSQMNAFISEGKVKLLGVSSAEPSPLAPPGTAVIAKTLPSYVVDVWFGILVASGTPPDVVAKLNAALVATLAAPDIQQRFAGFGVEAAASTPAELNGIIAAEVPEWQKIIVERGIKAE